MVDKLQTPLLTGRDITGHIPSQAEYESEIAPDFATLQAAMRVHATHPHYVHIVHHILSTEPQGAQQFAIIATVVLGEWTQLIPADTTRREFTFINTGANTIYLGDKNSQAGGIGVFALQAGAAMTFKGSYALWGGCLAPATSSFQAWCEKNV
jgi:hypothetical protein